MEKELKFILNDYETIRNFTREKYNEIIKSNPQDRPRDIAGLNYTVENNKIKIYDNFGRGYILIPNDNEREELIKKYYLDPETTGGYKKIYKLLIRDYAGISRQQVQDVVTKFYSYQQRQPIRVRKFVRPTIVYKPFQVWQMDILVLDKYEDENLDEEMYNKIIENLYKKAEEKGLEELDQDLEQELTKLTKGIKFRYLLVVVDVFSRYTFIQPLFVKSSNSIVNALIRILQEVEEKFGKNKKPKILSSDNAKEFKSKELQNF